MTEIFDIAIVGSGFSGSLLAMIAKRLGRSVVLLEKTRHPRFAIGESTTPLTNLLLDEIAVKYDLDRIRPLAKWGSWQRTYPEIGCGMKRGFTFYHHTLGGATTSEPPRAEELLVAASPHDAIADTHWYRPDFDHFLVREAQQMGVDYRDETLLSTPESTGDGYLLSGTRNGQTLSIKCGFLVDATGPRGFLFNAFGLGETELEGFPRTQGLYTHFTNVGRIGDRSDVPIDAPPYPVDDAALHHVFDGGWIWVLRFNNGITSAGAAIQTALADRLGMADKSGAWQRLLGMLPAVSDQFLNADAIMDFVHARKLSFLSERIVGDRWALLPSAAGFIDPLLSTGFPLTLLGIDRLATVIDECWETGDFDQSLTKYAVATREDLLAAADLVGALYRCMDDFELFRSVSKLYFAAVVYSESARRLGKPHLADSFLLRSNPLYGPRVREICERIKQPFDVDERRTLMGDIERIIEPFDVAGLTDPARKTRYPVIAKDLLDNSWKLDAGRDEVQAMLERSGFWV